MKRMILIFLLVCGVACGSLKWQDDSAMDSKFQHAYTTFNGWLIGGRTQVEAVESGIHVSDGQYSWFGGKLAGTTANAFEQMWGVPDVGIFTASHTPLDTTVRIQKAATDRDDFTEVMTPADATDTLGRTFVDCGWHTISGTPKRILMYFEYATDPKVWISDETTNATAGDSGTWTEFFAAAADAIAHFHGAKYIKGKGLYVFTGDSDLESSILFVSEEDFEAFIITPATWFAADHWALTDGDRAGWAADFKSDHVLGGNGQRWRTVELVTADSKIAYYLPDWDTGATGMSIYKIDLDDTTDSKAGTVTLLNNGGIPNVGWYGGASKSGIVYLTTIPYWDVTDWRTGHNGYCEIWAIDSETDEFAKVKRIKRTDWQPERGLIPLNGSWGGLVVPMTEFGGAMYAVLSEDKFQNPDIGGGYSPQGSICGRVTKQKRTSDNIITVGDFSSGDFTGWNLGPTVNNISFSSGDVEMFADDEIEGITSGSTATIQTVTHVSGTWAGGDEAGSLRLVRDTVNGIFVPGEKLKVATVVSTAAVEGISTVEVIADPTGQIGGNVARCVRQGTALPFGGVFNMYPDLSATQKLALEGNYVNWACKIYIDDSSTDGIDFRIVTDPRPGKQRWFRREESTPTILENTWLDINLADVVEKGATVQQYVFDPDADGNSGDYGLFYITDFQLVNGALSNSMIEQLESGARGGYRPRYGGSGR